MRLTRTGLRRALAGLWLLDGLLQLQPFMFTRGFANDILTPAAAGQPGWVAGPIHLSVSVVRAHPALANASFATIQLLIAIALLVPRLATAACAASFTWALGVWWLGEGFGGLASGHASIITGYPGAAAMYALLSAAARPPRRPDPETGPAGEDPLPYWIAIGWAVFWIGGAVVQLLPGQDKATDLANEISRTTSTPSWLNPSRAASLHFLATTRLAVPVAAVFALVIGLSAFGAPSIRRTGATLGATVAIVSWALAQGFGTLTSGQATDPNTGPLLLLLAAAIGTTPTRRPTANATTHADHASHPAARGATRPPETPPTPHPTLNDTTQPTPYQQQRARRGKPTTAKPPS